ncbi:MAG: glycosyltransferase [Candidatus Omnitrophica bacterium]|nr:glycosyltransferase [Candidatus Omnitrophota bacterium]
MKVLYIANRKDVSGGGQVSLLNLISALDRKRIDPLALCPGEGSLSGALRDMDVKTRIWDMPSPKTWRVGATLGKFIELRKIIEDTGADIVHTNGSRSQFYAAKAVKGTGAGLVWHVRVSFRDIPFYDEFLFRGADRVICASRGVVSAKLSFLRQSSRKLRVIYNGVDTDMFRPDMKLREMSRQVSGFTGDRRLLGTAGMIVPNKRFNVLVDAFARIKDEMGDLAVLIAGEEKDPEFSARLRKKAGRYGVSDRIFFLGRYSDMPAFFSSLDLFVLPSAREGFSRVLLEAMSCGLPVIATDVPGNNEAVQDGLTGILVPPDDPDSLALAVRDMLADKKKMLRMGEAAREDAKKRFSIQKHTRQVRELYEELLTERRSKK